MCLLIASTKKVSNQEWLRNGFTKNNHGAGFAYALEGKLFVKKGFFSFDSFIKEYSEIPEKAKGVVTHFRLSSGGKIDENNCHPYNITENCVLAHNGVFSNVDSCADYSDTHHLVEDILKPLFSKNTQVLFTSAASYLLSDFIGKWNKLAILNNKGNINIVNADEGYWEQDNTVWFSNKDYEKMSYKGSRWVKTYEEAKTSKPVVSNGESQTFDGWLSTQYSKYVDGLCSEAARDEDVMHSQYI